MGTFIRGAGDLRLGTTRNSGDLLTGLVNYWPMQEVSGNRSDVVGGVSLADNNTVGSGTGHVQATAARFVAANSEYFSNAALSFGDANYTWALWMNADVVVNNSVLLIKGIADLAEYLLIESLIDVNRYQLAWKTRAQLDFTTSGILFRNVWHLIVVAHDATNNQIYISVDGVAPVPVATAGSPATSAQLFTIGNHAATFFYDGFVEQVGRWSRVLTASDITSLWNGGAGRTYPFN
jgi:hypothetical protein